MYDARGDRLLLLTFSTDINTRFNVCLLDEKYTVGRLSHARDFVLIGVIY